MATRGLSEGGHRCPSGTVAVFGWAFRVLGLGFRVSGPILICGHVKEAVLRLLCPCRFRVRHPGTKHVPGSTFVGQAEIQKFLAAREEGWRLRGFSWLGLSILVPKNRVRLQNLYYNY